MAMATDAMAKPSTRALHISPSATASLDAFDRWKTFLRPIVDVGITHAARKTTFDNGATVEFKSVTE